MHKSKVIIRDIIFVFIFGITSYLLLFNTHYVELNGDTAYGTYGILGGIAKTIKDGNFPLWNPSLWGGMTTVGNPAAQAFYPITYLVSFLSYNSTTGVVSYYGTFYAVLIHLIILCTGFYVLFRVHNKSPFVSFVISILVTFCGNSYYMSRWIYIYAGIVYIPLFLAFTYLMLSNLNRKGLIYCSLAGLVFGISGLASTSHGVLFIILAFLFQYIVFVWKNKDDFKIIINATFKCVLTGVIGILIMSVSLFPLINFLKEAYRYIDGGDNIAGSSKVPYDMFIRDGVSLSNFRNIIGAHNGYFALGTFLAVLVILAFFSKKIKSSFYWLGMVFLIFGFAYSCTILFPQIMYYIPFYNQIREPFLYTFFFSIGAGILAVNILSELDGDNIVNKSSFVNFTGMVIILTIITIGLILPNNFNVVVTITMILALLFIFIPKNNVKLKNVFLRNVLLLLIVVSELLAFRQVLDKAGKYTISEAAEIVDQVNKEKLSLLGTDLPSNTDYYRIFQWVSKDKAYPANLWSLYGYGDEFGYMNPTYNKAMNIHLNWRLDRKMEMMNIRYLMCTDSEPEDYLTWISSFGVSLKETISNKYTDYNVKKDTNILVYENTNRKGNAWFVNQAITYKSDEKLSSLDDTINSDTFDPFKMALVDEDTADISLKTDYSQDRDPILEMKEYNANYISFNTDVSNDALMITSERMEDGWKVYIDGKQGDILTVNTAFRGVIVPAGQHLIEFKYLPNSFVFGSILSIMGLIISIVVFLVGCYDKHGARRSRETSLKD